MNGTVSMGVLLDRAGISSGSLYHRFGSREGVLASAWLDAVQAFQAKFLKALQSGLPTAGEDAAVATPKFCRTDRDRALILMSCRQSEFLGQGTPEPLRTRIRDVNAVTMSAVEAFSSARGIDIETCRMALIGIPLGAVRLYLPHRPVPRRLDDMVRTASAALIGSR